MSAVGFWTKRFENRNRNVLVHVSPYLSNAGAQEHSYEPLVFKRVAVNITSIDGTLINILQKKKKKHWKVSTLITDTGYLLCGVWVFLRVLSNIAFYPLQGPE